MKQWKNWENKTEFSQNKRVHIVGNYMGTPFVMTNTSIDNCKWLQANPSEGHITHYQCAE